MTHHFRWFSIIARLVWHACNVAAMGADTGGTGGTHPPSQKVEGGLPPPRNDDFYRLTKIFRFFKIFKIK